MDCWDVFKYKIVLVRACFLTILLWTFPFLCGKYVENGFPYIFEEDIPSELVHIRNGEGLCPVISPNLIGLDHNIYQAIDGVGVGVEELVKNDQLKPGGSWTPIHCGARHKVVIIVPYRNRTEHLQIFLSYMHPFLQRQLLSYRIIVVEQADSLPFNRARMLNVGFTSALQLGFANLSCFIFHDVDLLPENDHNTYACTHQPRHMYSAIDVFRYHLPYRDLFGGAVAILSSHFRQVDGFSNAFAGWGGEDDDLSRRLRDAGLVLQRFDPRVARYVMMPHPKVEPSDQRWSVMKNRTRMGGLSSLKFRLTRMEFEPLCTHLWVE